MKEEERIALIREAVTDRERVWADLGSGSGAFTSALASCSAAGSRIYSVDVDAAGLREQEREIRGRFPGVGLTVIRGDFTAAIDLPPLDGILMANALHFQKDACGVLSHVAKWLKPEGRLLLVEYDTDRRGPWVPYPVPSSRLGEIAACAGLSAPRVLGFQPSSYHGRMYAAVLYPRSASAT
jgi:SAM-dependent methyltransferase